MHFLGQKYKQIRSLDHQRGIIQRIFLVCSPRSPSEAGFAGEATPKAGEAGLRY